MRRQPEFRAAYGDGVGRSFDDLIAEAAQADVSGWDFGWLAGRATEQRPSWGYGRLLADRLGQVQSALDLQTGGGEVLGAVPAFPPTMAATESWPPNLAAATRRLHPRGVVVVAQPDDARLPFADASFDLVTSRHPAVVRWDEIARVLRPGGAYLGQHVGARSNAGLYEHFLGPDPTSQYGYDRDAGAERAAAEAAGLDVIDLRTERLQVEFLDVGAVVWFLRKVIWTVPDFSVERYGDRLRDLHERIEADGSFVCYSTRTLIEARKPAETPSGLGNPARG